MDSGITDGEVGWHKNKECFHPGSLCFPCQRIRCSAYHGPKAKFSLSIDLSKKQLAQWTHKAGISLPLGQGQGTVPQRVFDNGIYSALFNEILLQHDPCA